MAEWLSSFAPWRPHQWSFWNDTLEVARERGWHFRPGGKAHVHGTIACKPAPYSYPDSEVCSEVIFKTGGKNPEKVAKQIARKIRSCPHRASKTPTKSDHDGAESLLREVVILQDGAERLIDAERNLQEAASNLELATIRTEEAAKLLAAAGEAEDQAVAAQREGRAQLARVGKDSAGPVEALDTADDHLDAAETKSDRHDIATRIAAAKDRSAALRLRLLK